jgi:hypothetical protein
MLRRLLGAAPALAIAGLIFAAMPAKATTFNETIVTAGANPGFVIDLTGLTTDASNVAESLVSGNISGFGPDALLDGSLSLILPTTANQTIYAADFAWDGVAYPLAPYFSASSSSGILLYDSAGYILNPYYDPTNGLYYVSIMQAAGGPNSESNPGTLVGVRTADISQSGLSGMTPLPATWAMMLGGLALVATINC